MSFNYTNAPTGFYTTAAVIKIAEAHFPDEYDALMDPSQLGWEDLNAPGVSAKGLLIGYITVFGPPRRVLAGIASDGSVQFFMVDTRIASRCDWGRFRVGAPWTPLMEYTARPQLVKLQVLVQFFFALVGYTTGVVVERSDWFRLLEMACRFVGQSMGALPGTVVAYRPAPARADG